MAEQRKQGWGIGGKIAMGIGAFVMLLVIYVLSIGPVAKLAGAMNSQPEWLWTAVQWLYAPLLMLMWNNETLGHWLEAYLMWWTS